jgi:putative ABC transport system substrate-binding protein
MRRRSLVRLFGGATALLPLTSYGQRRNRLIRLGYLTGGSFNDVQLGFFRQGLAHIGWTEGRNFTLSVRYADFDYQRLPALTDELLREGIDLLVTVGPATRMVQITQRIVPIVFAFSGDPVAAGFVSGFARPGGNATGMSFLALELAGKRLDILREIQPTARRVAVLVNPLHPGEQEERRVTNEAATRLGLQTVFFNMRNDRELAAALAGIAAAGCDSFTCFPDQVTLANSEPIADHARRERLPSVFGWRNYCDAGGLVSYGPSMKDGFARLAYFVERIASGTNAADIPVELPTVIETVVNMKTAKAIGVSISPSILARANEVIE